MKGDDRRFEEGQLFDLPLEPAEESDELPLVAEEPAQAEPLRAPAEEPVRPAPAIPAAQRAGLKERWLAGGLDLGVHAALALVLVAGSRLAGTRLELADGAGFLLFLAIFSFLYTVIPLAFWGATPGMARLGLIARSRGDGALTFGQTGLRWLGGIATALALGLPTLLALKDGRSMIDRLSGSETWRRPA